MLSVGFVLFLATIVMGLGWFITMWLDPKQRICLGERLLLSFGVGCLPIYIAVSIIGHVRFDAISMWSLIGLLTLLAIPGWLKIPWSDILKIARLEIIGVKRNRWHLVLWLAAVLIGSSSLIQGLAPPNDYDSLLYHLSQPQFELEMGRFGIPWDRGVLNMFFPKLGGNFTRLSLATMGPGAAQMMMGIIGLYAAGAVAAIAFRLKFSKTIALLAAVIFLSIRAVVWEMATVEVDVALGTFTTFSVLAYIIWREHGDVRFGLLFGLLVGECILVKLYGFPVAAAFAPIMLFDLIKGRIKILTMTIAPLVALLVISPHLVRMYVLTGNPLFPAANQIFNPGMPTFFGSQTAAFGTGRGLEDLLFGPWYIFVAPMDYFDGMIFGSPLLLVFCPLLLLSIESLRRFLPVGVIAASYYLIWFYIGAQQVRFLLAIAPILALMGASGAVAMWRYTTNNYLFRGIFVAVIALLSLNQGLFVGIYSVLRLPPAIGLMDKSEYHSKTPTMNGAFYETCSYIRRNLQSGETYFSMAGPHSYYCPQAPVTFTYFSDEAKWWLASKSPPEMSIGEFIERSEKAEFRYFIFLHSLQNRRNKTARSTKVEYGSSNMRFGEYFVPVMKKLKPLITGPFTVVYDGPTFIDELKKTYGN